MGTTYQNPPLICTCRLVADGTRLVSETEESARVFESHQVLHITIIYWCNSAVEKPRLIRESSVVQIHPPVPKYAEMGEWSKPAHC